MGRLLELSEIFGPDTIWMEASNYMSSDENKEFNEHLEKIVDYPEDIELLSDRDKLAELEQYWSSDELDHFEYHMRRYYEWD